MSAGESSITAVEYQSFTGKPASRSRLPELAILSTIVGDCIYLGYAVALFIGFAMSGLFSHAVTVLLVTTSGVVGCVVLLAVKPKLHLIWGVTILVFSGWAIAVDGAILYSSYSYASSVVGPMAIFGVILYSVPLGLVLAGGVLIIRWKPPINLVA